MSEHTDIIKKLDYIIYLLSRPVSVSYHDYVKSEIIEERMIKNVGSFSSIETQTFGSPNTDKVPMLNIDTMSAETNSNNTPPTPKHKPNTPKFKS
jgi:hypothetical protein